MGLTSPIQLFNTSWTAHRLSPLHHGKDYQVLISNQNALKAYAKRLHDLIAGDFLRSMQVPLARGLADDALSKAGSLVECRWEFISTNENRHETDDNDNDDSFSIEMEECMGIFVTLDYEYISYRAALLTGPDGYAPTSTDGRREQSTTHLPLLLTRMPSALRQTFIDFISTTFDSYCATLHLPPDFLCMILETSISYMTRGGERSRETSNAILEQALKETQLTLSFGQSITPFLKTLDINLPRETMSKFARGGRRDNDYDTSLFLTSLSQYLDQNLAMKVNLRKTDDTVHDLKNHQHAWLSKVATGTYVLSTEGRFKLIDTSSSQETSEEQQTILQKLIRSVNEEILRLLVRRATSDDMIT